MFALWLLSLMGCVTWPVAAFRLRPGLKTDRPAVSCAKKDIVAVYGGTFDPPTKAHAGVIETLAIMDEVKKVIVVPAGDGDLADQAKKGKTEYPLRFKWVETMKAGFPTEISSKVVVSDVEQNRALDSAEVLSHLHEGDATHMYFVVGTDYADSLHTWQFKVAPEVPWKDRCFFVGIREAGETEEGVMTIMRKHWSEGQIKIFVAPEETRGLSSSEAKKQIFQFVTTRRVSNGTINGDINWEAIEKLLPSAVLEELSNNETLDMLSEAYKEKKPEDAARFEEELLSRPSIS